MNFDTMKYNKEYIEQLLQRFMDGETTEQEETFLAKYFSTNDSISEELEAYRELFASFSTDAYDFTEEEISKFIKEEAPKHRTIRLWPWLAAACVAALMVVFLAPPKAPLPPKGELPVVLAVKDSVMPDKPETKEQQHLIASIKHKTQGKVKKKITVSMNQEPILAENECVAKSDEPVMDEDRIMAEQMSQFNEIEAAFLSHSAPIRERGQQVIHRVSMLQQEQRSQHRFVEL